HGADPFDLAHGRTLAARVWRVEQLRDDAVEPRAFTRQPVFGGIEVGSLRRGVRAAGRAEVARGEGFEAEASLTERLLQQRRTSLGEEQVKSDEDRGMLCREPLHATRRGMDPLQQLLEGRRTTDWHDQFAVEHESTRSDGVHGFDDIGEISLEGLARLRLKQHLIAVAEDETAKAVPLRLVAPLLAVRDALDLLCLGRWQWVRDG